MKFLNLFVVASILAISTATVQAQKSFEGTVSYGITYEDLDETMAAYESMLPKEMIFKFKGEKSKMIQPSPMGETVVITDMSSKTSTVLMNIMGKKMALEQGGDSKSTDDSKKPDIKYIEESVKIAGYNCKKAEIKSADSDDIITVWYTNEINASSNQFKALKGFPMKYEMGKDQMTMVLEAKTVKAEKLSKGEFTIPKDYEKVTEEEFKSLMGGATK